MKCWATLLATMLVKGKGAFLWSAVSSLWDWPMHFTLHPLVDPFIPTPSRVLWEAFSKTLQLLREDYSFKYPPLSLAKYSFIQLSELWQRGMNKIAKASKRQQPPPPPHISIVQWTSFTKLLLRLKDLTRLPSKAKHPDGK